MKKDCEYNDAHLQAMIDKLQLKDPEDLQCEAARKIRKICINPKCKRFSLLCGSYDCKMCNEEAH